MVRGTQGEKATAAETALRPKLSTKEKQLILNVQNISFQIKFGHETKMCFE